MMRWNYHEVWKKESANFVKNNIFTGGGEENLDCRFDPKFISSIPVDFKIGFLPENFVEQKLATDTLKKYIQSMIIDLVLSRHQNQSKV